MAAKFALLWGGPERARSRRGITAWGIAIFVVIAGASGSQKPASAAIVLLVFSPLIWWIGWWLAGWLQGFWDQLVQGRPPEISVGREWQGGSSRMQLRQDGNARLFSDRGGILLHRRHWFAGSGTPPLRLTAAQYEEAACLQLTDPVRLGAHRDRDFWWYQSEFFWTNNAAYTSQDVKALLFTRERQRQRQLEHAHALLAAGGSPAARKRESIPKEVKLTVFQRDQGRCVECDSDFDIQYDHIIPFSMGGANTIENLQLLCARCNQQKGGRL